MEVLNATHDVGGGTHETAALGGKTAPGGRSILTRGKGGSALGVLRKLLGPGSRGGWSAWRVTAMAILTYVAAVNLSYFFVLKPIWSRLNVLVEKKGVIQDFLIVRESAAAVSGFKDGLMHGDQRMTVVAEFDDLAQEAGLRIVGEPGLLPPKEISKKLVEYPVEIDLRGTYHEVGHFLSLLEASPRCPLVTDVEVISDEGGSRKCGVRLRIAIASWVD
jgi:Tfp pilus assembly protein PilO